MTRSGQTERPLRIVQAGAFPFPSPQGSQVFVRGMARALARRGHAVSVVCYGHGLGQPDPEYQVIRTPKVPGYRRLRAGPDPVKPVLDIALAARIAATEADIVHAHNYEAAIAALAARHLTGVPVVYNAHNTMGEELPTYFSGRLATHLASRLGRTLDHAVPRWADHALALTPQAAETLRGLGCDRVSCVAPGVDVAEFDDVTPATLAGGPWVVYAGNPDKYQDLEVLVAAMGLVPEAGLLLISASDLGAWQRTGLDRLRCEVTSDFDRVKSLVAGAAVAALPRAVCSGYPIKLLNYLGLGVPTVAAAGSAQALPGVICVPNRDPTAMAEAIRSLLEDPVNRTTLGSRARTHVRETCGWDVRVQELEAVYATVLRDCDRTAARHSRYRSAHARRYTAGHTTRMRPASAGMREFR
jgi:1,2-diacylglycerol 3-alpha-glucosyltransferase